ncbi:MAG TPA: hypothetical protein VKZ41_12030 [Gemmatimonadales bacterium]|nr:hypothetical protein [Gemmatimonadales bacterium]
MHLTSALRFPELGASHPSGAVSSMQWRLDVSSEPPGQLEDSRQLGEAEYAGGVRISLSRNHTTWELSTSDAGVWTFEPHEGRMHWHRDNVAGDAKGRFDALGRVMPLMLHATGALVLHGSSVATKHGGIALLGPKGRGKSTLAVACADAGAALAGDDVAVLRGGEQPMLYPSVGFARLHADSATELGRDANGAGTWGSEKMLVPAGSFERRLTSAVPLRAIYFLEAAPADVSVVRRERVTGAAATVTMLTQATNALLLGGEEQLQLMQRVSEFLAKVPVFVLHVPRSMKFLGAAAEELLRWIGEDGGDADVAEPAPLGSVGRRNVSSLPR